VLKSGTQYWNAYKSAQIALYSETYSSENDLTSVLNDNYAPSANISWANLSGLANVSNTPPTSGALLLYNGTEWVPTSGSKTMLFNSKPALPENYKGQIIRVSGGASEKTWIYMSAKNSLNNWVWVQLGVTS